MNFRPPVITFSCNIVRNIHTGFRIRSNKSTGNKVSKSSNLLNLLLEMPKDMKHVTVMQQQRNAKKVTKTKYPPSHVSLKVLGSGARGAPRSLYLSSDQACYLFNCGEGSQRMAHEHGLKLAKLEHIFFTQNSWSNIGGLPGISLTIQESGVPSVSLYGAPSLPEFFNGASRFVILEHLAVSHIDATIPGAFFEDTALKIDYIHIQPKSYDVSRSPHRDSPIEEDDTANYYNSKSGNVPAAKRTKIDNEELRNGSKSVLAYVGRLQPKQGMLMPEKCFKLGVPPGPLYGDLKAGRDVTLPDGRVVLASDVRTPDDPGPIFLVVDCPDETYLDNFISEPRLACFQITHDVSAESEESGRKSPFLPPQVIVHFTPAEIVAHPKYRQWMGKFSAGIKHMMLGLPSKEDSNRGLGSLAIHRIQHKLHMLDENIFPLLPIDMPMIDQPDGDECQTLSAYHLRPEKKFDTSSQARLNLQEYVDETLAVEGFSASLDQLKLTLAETVPLSEKKYPRITFLGTGSCIPSKTRNTSAILVELEPDRFMLMDCGEGTYGQMVRFFGHDRSTQVLSNLVAVYISHLHADHHIGLIGLLQGRRYSIQVTGTNPGPITLIAPHQISYWLKTYHTIFEKIVNEFNLVPAVNLLPDKQPDPSILELMQLKSIVTTHVRHCPNAFGLTLTTTDGFKLTYSGDTMPSQGLIDIGRDSDLLIHEATMEDGMEAEATLKTHSTTSQAIEVGRSMGAKYTLLTHFSQRYSKIPVFSGGNLDSANVGVAFDNMCISPDRLHCLPHFIPALKLMFAEHCEVMTARMQKRKMKQQLLQTQTEKQILAK